ncbi:hypothetical protein KL86DYS2_10883 [uncultured Dysgonomonas sp.]|uniref:Uncharacterized protein n=1 Tax=uncultured Dysgonomonas sp. TaxID=206096 RepID=A0A212J7B3_9BACT|nr:hypothetical protein [uncultured Dysgonomonas sp.]SBV95294.1 hypothetical protein KL86DYS2_10883 [uncultured Dysgonomonas sp.]
MNKNYYNINFGTTGEMLLPTFLRRPLIMAFVTAMMKAPGGQQRTFLSFIESLELNVYSQVCCLEGLINDEFDFYDRRIKVKNAPVNKDYYLFWEESKNKPVRLMEEEQSDFKPYMFSVDGQIGRHNYDFEIILPPGFTLSPGELNRLKIL